MKFKKADTEILFEALNNGSCVQGRKGKLMCSYVGTVEVVVGEVYDYESGPYYETDYFLAGQLPSGEIIWIDNDNAAHSLSNELAEFWWGFYPDGFPEEKKTKRPCPKKFKPRYNVCTKAEDVPVTDELPF